MYICNYCKRNFKKKHETCPVCGGINFSEKAYLGETIIKTPPKGGYKINMDNFEERRKRNKKSTMIGILIAIGVLAFEFPFSLIAILSIFTSIIEMNFSIEGLAIMIPLIFPAIVLIITIIIRYKSNKALNLEIKKET